MVSIKKSPHAPPLKKYNKRGLTKKRPLNRSKNIKKVRKNSKKLSQRRNRTYERDIKYSKNILEQVGDPIFGGGRCDWGGKKGNYAKATSHKELEDEAQEMKSRTNAAVRRDMIDEMKEYMNHLPVDDVQALDKALDEAWIKWTTGEPPSDGELKRTTYASGTGGKKDRNAVPERVNNPIWKQIWNDAKNEAKNELMESSQKGGKLNFRRKSTRKKRTTKKINKIKKKR